MTLNQLELYIEKNKNIVIGIDGPCGSGKSTVSSYLEEKYDITVFHVDDYFLPISRKTAKRLNEPGGNFDYERMEKEIFLHLHDTEITSNKFNCKTGHIELGKPTSKKSIVLIEGVYSLHPKFRKYYDFTVFLEVDKETQLKRILKRSNAEMLQRFINEFIPLEELYFDKTQLRNNVDLIIKN